MEIHSKYNLNQKVYHIANRKEEKWIPCLACDGIGKVTLKDNTPRMCPECYGRQGKTEYLDTKWQYDMSLTIGQVRVYVENIEPDGIFSNVGYYKEGNTKQKTEYMAYETGIGSGNIWYEEDLFPSMEDAQLECDNRNEAKDETIK